MENKSILIFSAICALIIGGVVGYQLGFSGGEKSSQTKIEKLLAVFPPTPEVLEISGSVKEVGDDYFVLESQKIGNPIEEFPTTRKALVGSETSIQKYEKGKPMEADWSEIKTGISVMVSASSDVKNLEQFEAKLVKIAGGSSADFVIPAGGSFTPPPSVPAN
jgi:hypothetical protein